jgi:tol-pal system protein YbgF
MLKVCLKIGGVIAAVALIAGCAADNGDVQQLNQNEFTLRGMIASDRQQIDSLQQQVRQLNDQIAELKHEPASDSGGAADSGVSQRLSKLETEVAALNAGMVASPGAAAPPAAAGMPPPAGDDTGTPPPANALASAPEEAPPEAAPAAEPPPTWPNDLDAEIESSQTSKEQGVKLYRQGLDAMKAQNYPLAVNLFTKLQHQYPKSELSEPAQYFAANALFETGKYDQSILQFNDLVMRYPKGRFASPALLREAEAFIKMNDKIDAKLTLQKLQSDHAGSPEANSANEMMKQLVSD